MFCKIRVSTSTFLFLSARKFGFSSNNFHSHNKHNLKNGLCLFSLYIFDELKNHYRTGEDEIPALLNAAYVSVTKASAKRGKLRSTTFPDFSANFISICSCVNCLIPNLS